MNDLMRRAKSLRYRARGKALALALGRMVVEGPPITKLGSRYGGWGVPIGGLGPASVVYSVGIGEDVTFDEALIRAVGCEVLAFDPTPKAIAYARSVEVPGFHAYPYGLSDQDSKLWLFEPSRPEHASYSIYDRSGSGKGIWVDVRSLDSLMVELGHSHVDLLKMDIEGAEPPVLEAIVRSANRPTVVAVELECDEPVVRTVRRIRRLLSAGYDLVSVERRNCVLMRR